MIKKLKYFLWSNAKTKLFYRFLWYWKNRSFYVALDYFKHPESYENKATAPRKVTNSPKVSAKKTAVNNQVAYSEFPIIESVWRMEGASSQVLERLSFYEKSFWCWNNIDHRLWLIYICCLLEKKEREHAIFLLNRFTSKFQERDIERFLPAASLAYELGIKNKKIYKAHTVFQALEKQNVKSKLSELINGKTVAVVGNGPFELDTGHGEEIDGHDIVIRFNNYPTIGYQKDYGKRTDIWVRGGSFSVKDRPNIDQYKLVIWEPDYWHIAVQYNHLDILYRDIKKAEETITYLADKPQWNIFEKTQNANPTTGFFILWLLKEIRGNFKGIDIYGMSFPYEDTSEHGHYYDQLSEMHSVHTMYAEEACLRKLFYENGGRVPSLEECRAKQQTSPQVTCPQLFNQIPRPKIYAIAYRKYDEKKGRTGGPGGVLATQKRLFGDTYKGIKIEYCFEPNAYPFEDSLKKRLNQYSVKLSCNLYANEYVLSEKGISEAVNDNTDILFICHDVGSAYGAYNTGKKYVLIYHQQGSLVSEALAFGEKLSDMEMQMLNDIEDIVFHNAQAVYFPSNGAKNEYINSCQIDCSGINFAGCLYNTVPAVYTTDDVEKTKKKYGILDKQSQGYEIFLTVADYNKAKGVDRIPDFLNDYVTKCSKKVLWICAGNATTSGIFEALQIEKSSWKFESILIGNRINHSEVLALMEFCDFYIMLHRKSIFDLATLEAMRAGLIPVLSQTGGNIEFNKNDNVIFVDQEDNSSAIEKLQHLSIPHYKEVNKLTFDTYFSEKNFYEEYAAMIDREMEKAGISLRVESKLNRQFLSEYKNFFKGDTAIICGGGASLSNYTPIVGATHIALNRAIFYNNIKYDFLFMQDAPSEGMAAFNNYPCKKFYGIIKNPDFENLGIKRVEAEGCCDSIFYYELSPSFFNCDVDLFEFELDKYCLSDAQSVLFSALQFAVYAGFKRILLVGVDFSDTNYDSGKNTSKYARAVLGNLLAFKRQLRDYDETIDLNVINTTNPVIQRSLGVYDQIITVTGVCSEAYEGVLALQKQTCLDSYRYDFQHFTNEEWARMGTSSENDSFWGYTTGLVIRVDVTIDRIKKYWGKLLLLMDADIVFLRETEAELLAQLKDRDMLFIKERLDEHNLYERSQRNINIGFVLMRCNEASLKFWEEIRSRVISKRGWDQEECNLLLLEQPGFIKWGFFTDDYCNGGDIKKKTVKQKAICTSCGTVAKRYFLSKEEYLIKMHNIAIGKSKVWLDGSKM